MIDKNLHRQSHIKLFASKISKNIGVLFKGSLHLIRRVYQYVSHLFIYKYVSYMGYGNTAWARTSQNKHKKILGKNMLFQLYFMNKKKLMEDPFEMFIR